MVIDMSVVREVWDGGVIGRFTLAPHEVTGTGTPSPCFLMLQRNSYLPLINEKIEKHFSHFVKQIKDESSDVWYEFNGCPLRWQHPVGVLFDTLCPDNEKKTMEITVHFRDFPEESIIRFSDVEAVEANFMSMLKEADHLKHRGQVINNMNKSQHKQLWNSLRNDNFEQFWSINTKLMEGHEGTSAFKYVPLRIYDKDNVYQKLVAPSKEEIEVTLRDCLNDIFHDKDLSPYNVIVHGIEVPLDSTLQWLSEHLSYADNFLHVALLKKVE